MKACTIACVMTFAHAFIPPRRATELTRIRHERSLNSRKGSPNKRSSEDISEDDENAKLLDELRRTKKDLFGAKIPLNQELEGAAQNAEDAFLAAMLKQTQQFQQIKSKEGSEKAIDAFMERIQEADEDRKLEEDEEDITWQ